MFAQPDKVFYPETWLECLNGNLSKEGITADLEALSAAGFAGVQMFFGNQTYPWPGVKQILCLSKEWEDFVEYAAGEAHRLGLRFTLQNCPGWAMAGGPWVEPDKAMRNLVWTKTIASDANGMILPLPEEAKPEWSDYNDVMVLAFPAPLGETVGAIEYSITPQIIGSTPRAAADKPNVFDITLANEETIRTVEFSSVQASSHWYCYDPGIHAKMEAVYPDGSTSLMFDTDWPQSEWQDLRPFSVACSDAAPSRHFRLSVANTHDAMKVSSFRLFAAARSNNWESEAAWCLRSIMKDNAAPKQDPAAWVDSIVDLTGKMDSTGRLTAELPEGEWCIFRIGEANSGMRNAPAPPEATGFECSKLSTEGPDCHFHGYVGKLADGMLKGLLDGMLMDSWECQTQTWTRNMEREFKRVAGYDLRPWIPALMGYVVKDPETTAMFLRDWRATLNDLVVNKFYGRMAELAHERGLSVSYETACGDVIPGDIMEYFKFADIPMCEFWVNNPEVFVGTFNFKPVKPTASAVNLYGKPRTGAEAYTSFQQTWDEQLRLIRETGNKNFAEGVSYPIYHTCTHNPAPGKLVPGSSFGAIGSPFLPSQTWWDSMKEFNDCSARTTFMLERGRPVADVLWYLGDELDHKPDQEAPFPAGYKYDYCNPDVLLNRLSVRNGNIVTPEGISYRVLWVPAATRFVPETLEKMVELVKAGATLVADVPIGLASLKDPEISRKRFDDAVQALWGGSDAGVRSVGKGQVFCGVPIGEVLDSMGIVPDLLCDGALWRHRKAKGADLYYVTAPKGGSFEGDVSLRASGHAELWDPVTGEIRSLDSRETDGRLVVHLSLARSETCFIVVRPEKIARKYDGLKEISSVAIESSWKVSIPEGWGLDGEYSIPGDQPQFLQDLDIPEEAKAFSGHIAYSSSFSLDGINARCVLLELPEVEHIARVTVNGRKLRSLWTWPYRVDVTDCLKPGENSIVVEVTNTWFNRLLFDVRQDEPQRKTWATNYPAASERIRPSGLSGKPVLRFLD
jgi:Glycosyl hydrolases family 2, sugar binding domain.